jgi:hypothetical protein
MDFYFENGLGNGFGCIHLHFDAVGIPGKDHQKFPGL